MGEAEIVSLGLAYAKKNIKNLINMYVYYMSVCHTSGSCQQKQNAGKIWRS
jgi:hypothetical protein